MREWIADLSRSHAPASVHKTIGVLRQVLAMAVAENRLVVNPVDNVELPAVETVEQRFITLEQLHAPANAAGEHRPLVYVLGTCGLRFGEVAELTRTQPTGSDSAEEVSVRRRWWSDAVSAAQLFPRIERNAAGDEITVYDFKLHELQHTSASLAIQVGANVKSLQNMLGHASAALTLDRYGHLYESDVEAVGVAMNALLTRECGQNVVTDAA